MSHIFISYSHKDKKYVEKLEQKLIEEGFNVWIDHRIDFGTEWPKVIQKALDDCDAFIVVVSENAFESKWVQNELARADRKEKHFLPLLLQGDPWLSVEATQYVDVRDGSLPPEKFYKRLAAVTPLKKKVEPPHPKPDPAKQTRANQIGAQSPFKLENFGPPRIKRKVQIPAGWMKTMLIGIVALGTLFGFFWLLPQVWPVSHSPNMTQVPEYSISPSMTSTADPFFLTSEVLTLDAATEYARPSMTSTTDPFFLTSEVLTLDAATEYARPSMTSTTDPFFLTSEVLTSDAATEYARPTITDTPNSITQTVSAGITLVAISTQTVIPTSTSSSPNFADDVGVPGLLIAATTLIVVIWLARRLRAVPTR